MPNKRSDRKKTPKFYCPYCSERLWRVGSPKHHLYYQDSLSISKNCNISRKNSKFLANKGEYVDQNQWLEEFFCGDHGKIWLLLAKRDNGVIEASLPQDQHWQQTTGTFDPDRPNPSVSEYSYRMSRGT
ncbi:MAG: hypothetical protein HC890_14455 [Chloroflexaceae bacterium]|nr:hypothetical protein [Chloroflexaceae bacterium]